MDAGFPDSGAARLASHVVRVAGVELVADPAGALFHEAASLLLVADLHLEKGSFFASRRMLVPPYDTIATLARLTALIARYRPRAVVALGDSFHDRRASERLDVTNRDALLALQAGRDWIWIAGNHDPEPILGVGGTAASEMRLGPLVLRHEPAAGAAAGEIAGHLHPVARVISPSGSVRRRCFVIDGARCVMPAFGAYAGGLNLFHPAFAPLFAGPVTAHVLGRDRVYAVPHTRCVGD